MMIALNTKEFTDSLNDIILLVSCMVSNVCPRASVVKGQGYGGP